MVSIVAPNNSGKSTYATNHPAWIDHDVLLLNELGMGPQNAMSKADMVAADGVTLKHKRTGDRMLVATWWNIALVDAFVIIPKTTMQKRLADGTLTRSQFDEAQRQAGTYQRLATANNKLILPSFAAADALFGMLD